jgi:hypothetical protein
MQLEAAVTEPMTKSHVNFGDFNMRLGDETHDLAQNTRETLLTLLSDHHFVLPSDIPLTPHLQAHKVVVPLITFTDMKV